MFLKLEIDAQFIQSDPNRNRAFITTQEVLTDNQGLSYYEVISWI